jgi:aminopeptidase N
VVHFGLLPALRVARVTADSHEIPYIQEDRKQDGSFYVIMPQAMKKDASYKLRVEYEGDHVITSHGNGNFAVGARTSWYPSINTFLDRATYELVFKVPKNYTVVSVGKLEKESKEQDFAVSEWKSDVPLAVAGFNYGLFKKKRVIDSATKYEVEAYATEDVPDYLREAAEHQNLTPAVMADRAVVDGQNSIRLFEKMFGPCPYGRIAITQQPQANFGQSWPSLVYLPLFAFFDSTQRWMLMGSQAFRYAEFIQEVTPHEIAHQWWGHMVGWASYHDQWLSEGFAEFSAGVFVEATEKPGEANRFWDRLREEIVQKNQFGISANEAGPIWMGLRLNNFHSPGAYNRLVYPKGAYILQMLRMLMREDKTGDDDFLAMMQDYVKTHLNRNATSETFKAVVEKHMKPVLDMEGNHRIDWFYRDWVYSSEMPKYRLEYSIAMDGGKAHFTGRLTQSDVSANFLMRVPIYFEIDGHMLRAGFVSMRGNTTSNELKIALPKKPKRVVLNAFHDILASDITVKEM